MYTPVVDDFDVVIGSVTAVEGESLTLDLSTVELIDLDASESLLITFYYEENALSALFFTQDNVEIEPTLVSLGGSMMHEILVDPSILNVQVHASSIFSGSIDIQVRVHVFDTYEETSDFIEKWTDVQVSWTPFVSQGAPLIESSFAAIEDQAVLIALTNLEMVDSDGSEVLSLFVVEIVASGSSSSSSSLVQSLYVNAEASFPLTELSSPPESFAELEITDGFDIVSIFQLDADKAAAMSVSILPIVHYSGDVALKLISITTDSAVVESSNVLVTFSSTTDFTINFSPSVDELEITVDTALASVDEDNEAEVTLSGLQMVDTDGSETLSLVFVEISSSTSSKVSSFSINGEEITSTSGVFDGSHFTYTDSDGLEQQLSEVDGISGITDGSSSALLHAGTIVNVFVAPPSVAQADTASIVLSANHHYAGAIKFVFLYTITDVSTSSSGNQRDTFANANSFTTSFGAVVDFPAELGNEITDGEENASSTATPATVTISGMVSPDTDGSESTKMYLLEMVDADSSNIAELSSNGLNLTPQLARISSTNSLIIDGEVAILDFGNAAANSDTEFVSGNFNAYEIPTFSLTEVLLEVIGNPYYSGTISTTVVISVTDSNPTISEDSLQVVHTTLSNFYFYFSPVANPPNIIFEASNAAVDEDNIGSVLIENLVLEDLDGSESMTMVLILDNFETSDSPVQLLSGVSNVGELTAESLTVSQIEQLGVTPSFGSGYHDVYALPLSTITADFVDLRLTTVPHFSGDVKFTAYYTVTDVAPASDNRAETTASVTREEAITYSFEAVADSIELEVTNLVYTAIESTPFDFPVEDITLQYDDTDGSEIITLTLQELGSANHIDRITVGGVAVDMDSSGSFELGTDLSSMKIFFADFFAGVVGIKLTATTTESSNSDEERKVVNIQVNVLAVADSPTLEVTTDAVFDIDEDASFEVYIDEIASVDTDNSETLGLRIYCDVLVKNFVTVDEVDIYKQNVTETTISNIPYSSNFLWYFEIPAEATTITMRALDHYSGELSFDVVAYTKEVYDLNGNTATLVHAHTPQSLTVKFKPVPDSPLFEMLEEVTIQGVETATFNANLPLTDYMAPLVVTKMELVDKDGSEELDISMTTTSTKLDGVYIWDGITSEIEILPTIENGSGTKTYAIPKEYAYNVYLLPKKDESGLIEVDVSVSAYELSIPGTLFAETRRLVMKIVKIEFPMGKSVHVAEGLETSQIQILLGTAPTNDVVIRAATVGSQVAVSPAFITFTSQAYNVLSAGGNSDFGVFTITSTNDNFQEPTPHYETIQLLVDSMDDDYGSLFLSDIIVSIDDNDFAGLDIEENGMNGVQLDYDEFEESASFFFGLTSRPVKDVTVTLGLKSGTIPEGFELFYYLGIAENYVEGETTIFPYSTLTFLTDDADDWKIPRTFVFKWLPDFVAAPDFNLVYEWSMETEDPFYSDLVFDNTDIALSVIDDDVAGLIVSTAMTTNSPVGTLTITGTQGGGSTLASKYYLSLNSEPAFDVTVEVLGFSEEMIMNDGEYEGELLTFTFTPANWDVVQKVKVAGFSSSATGSQGRFEELSHKVTSADVMYDAMLSGGVSVDLVITADAVPPPTLAGGRFDDNGAGGLIWFSGTSEFWTNAAGLTGSFACIEVLDVEATLTENEGRTLGDAPMCQWMSPVGPPTNAVFLHELKITFGFSPTIMPGDAIFVLGGKMQSSMESASLFMASSSTFLSKPLNPVAVSVKASYSSAMGICDIFEVDASMTTGGAGRAMVYTWAVMEAWPEHDLNLIVAHFAGVNAMNDNHGVNKLMDDKGTALPRALMNPGTVYTFRLQVTNFLAPKTKSSELFSVDKGSLPSPIVLFASDKIEAVTSDDVNLELLASLPELCAEAAGALDPAKLQMEYIWEETTGNLAAAGVTFDMIQGNNKRLLSIGADLLDADTEYEFTAVARLAAPEYNHIANSATAFVHMGRQDVIAKIAGGDRDSGTDQVLTIIADETSDPDNMLSLSDLTYEWSCRSWAEAGYDEESETMMMGYVGDCGSKANEITAAENGVEIAFPSATFGSNQYEFSVTVSHETFVESAVSTASALVVIKAGQPPSVSINKLAVDKFNNNADTFAEMESSYEMKGNYVRSYWELISGEGVVSDIFYTKDNAGGYSRPNMILSLGDLSGGSTYVFKYTVYDDQSADSFGSAAITVVTNSPPTSGMFAIEPIQGEALVTEFNFFVDFWQDDASDLPLTYLFKSIKGVETSNSAESPLMDNFSPSTSKASLVPLGDELSADSQSLEGVTIPSYAVTGVVYIADKYGSSTRQTFLASCIPMVIVLEEGEDLTDVLAAKNEELVAAAMASGDPTAVNSALAGAAAMLNAVGDDEEEEEEEYYYDYDDGYEYDPNAVFTFAPSAAPLPTDSPSASPTIYLAPGETNSPTAAITVSPSSAPTVESEEKKEARRKRAAMRESMLNDLLNAQAITDVSEAAMDQQSGVVESVCSTPSELTANSQDGALGLVGNLMGAALEGGVAVSEDTAGASTESMSQLMETNMFKGGEEGVRRLRQSMSRNGEEGEFGRKLKEVGGHQGMRKLADEKAKESADKITGTIGALSSGMLSDSLAGMPPKLVNQGNIRMANERKSPAELGTVKLPQTRREKMTRVVQPTFTMPSGFAEDEAVSGEISGAACVDTQSNTLAKNPYESNGELLSSGIQSLGMIKCAEAVEDDEGSDSDSEDSGELIVGGLATPIIMTIPKHLDPITGLEAESKTYNGTCTQIDEVLPFECPSGVQTYTCTNEQTFNSSWVKGYTVDIEFDCGGPTCQWFDPVDNRWSKEGCSIVENNPDALVCACTHLTAFGSRLESSMKMAGAILDILGSLTLSDILDNLAVITTLIVMYSVFILGCIYGRYLDKKDRYLMENMSIEDKRDEIDSVSAFKTFGNEIALRDKSGKIQVLRDWWTEMKENHKVISVIYGTDKVFSRPQRLTTLLLIIMSKM